MLPAVLKGSDAERALRGGVRDMVWLCNTGRGRGVAFLERRDV